MSAPVRVSLPDEKSGRALVAALSDSFGAECRAGDGGWEVIVAASDGHDRLLAELLPRLEQWLAAEPKRVLSVEFDGRSYAMVAPAQG